MGYGLLPDGAEWVDAYGRIWVVNGDDLKLWADPTLTLSGDDPQRVAQGGPYLEAGATAAECTGVDLTGDIVTDSSSVDTDTPGEYHVTYTVTDTEGATTVDDREVLVIDIDRPDVRDVITALLEDSLPDGVYVYSTAAEQVKLPAVVVGTLSWVPARQNALGTVRWSGTVTLLWQRSMPRYGQYSLATLGVKVAQDLVADGVMVGGYDETGTVDVGGVEALSAVVEFEYLSSERAE